MDQQMMQGIGVSPSSPPQGGLARLAGPIDGTYRIISVWESAEAWETFKTERMEPHFQRIGQPMPDFKVWELDTFMTPQT
jgi:hypothetical protein